MNKIFGIGLSHTGTKSLNTALNILGIKSVHWPRDYTTYRELSGGRYDLTILKKYQAITDITTAPFYRQFDEVHRGSKFILTVRDKVAWLKTMRIVNSIWRRHARAGFMKSSIMRWCEDVPFYGWRALPRVVYRKTHERCIEFQRRAVYGDITFANLDELSQVYDRHINNVRAYFKDRPDDLLVIDVCGGEGWMKLCSFLSKPVPAVEFPHVRTKTYT